MLSAAPTFLHDLHRFTQMLGDTTGGEVTRYWLFACSVFTAKANRRASHLFTPLPAPDRESHGTKSRGQ